MCKNQPLIWQKFAKNAKTAQSRKFTKHITDFKKHTTDYFRKERKTIQTAKQTFFAKNLFLQSFLESFIKKLKFTPTYSEMT